MVEDFLRDPHESLAVLTGYAGTGKTTLLQKIAEQHGAPLLVTPTGKAAVRATEATGLETSTIHRLIYKPAEDPETGEVTFARKTVDDFKGRKLKLVVIDEASMVNQKLWSELWDVCTDAGFKILAVGDTFQLPPVERDGGGFNLLQTVPTEYRSHLSEIMRQALENPIVRASMILREQPSEWYSAYGLLCPISSKKVLEKTLDLRGRGVTIAYTNKFRHQLNRDVREALGFGDHLETGEPLLVQQNNYGIDRYNGEVVEFGGWMEPPNDQSRRIVIDRSAKVSVPPRYTASFGVAVADGKPVLLSPEDVAGQVGDTPSMFLRKAGHDAWSKALGEAGGHTVFTRDGEERWLPPPLLRANYGYALTCHKSQGSEWDEVVVAVESWLVKPDTLMGRRWLYTAFTRARKRVWIASV